MVLFVVFSKSVALSGLPQMRIFCVSHNYCVNNGVESLQIDLKQINVDRCCTVDLS